MDPKDLRQAFANNPRRLRHAKGISQEDLAYEPAELLRVPTASGLLVNYAAIIIGAPARLFTGFAWTPCMSIWRPFRVCPNVNRYIRSRSCGIGLDPRNWWITLWITSPTLT